MLWLLWLSLRIWSQPKEGSSKMRNRLGSKVRAQKVGVYENTGHRLCTPLYPNADIYIFKGVLEWDQAKDAKSKSIREQFQPLTEPSQLCVLSRPSDQRRHHPPLRPAGWDPAGGGVNDRLPLRGHATRCHPPDTNQHENRVPEEAAMATNRRQPQGTAIVRLHSLARTLKCKAERRSSGAGAARDAWPRLKLEEGTQAPNEIA
jgi:hypothetical protein